MNRQLVIIDPQYDFCDPAGSLFVQGADKDMERLGSFIKKMKKTLKDVHITLDQHHELDIAHSIFWVDSKGEYPNPFTIISSEMIKNGEFNPFHPSLIQKMIKYTVTLETSGRYPLCIWPTHCLIGSLGATIANPIREALSEWILEKRNVVDFVAKGSNPLTEHYSAIKAEVEDPTDPSTLPNIPLVQTLEEADEVLLSGEALSHCLANTGRDIFSLFSSDEYIKKCILLTDATSSVAGFEQLGDDFISEMTAKGMQTALTTDF